MNNKNYYDDEDDYWEEDEEEEFEKDLPAIVRRVLDDRTKINHPRRSLEDGKVIESPDAAEQKEQDETIAASDEVIDALKDHVKAGLFDPAIYGGYMTVLQDLGVTPKSSDPYVKESEHNTWVLTVADEEHSREKLDKVIQEHRAEVRYLRYQEFIHRQGNDFSEYYWGEDDSNGCKMGPVPTMKLMLEEEAKGNLCYDTVKKDGDLTKIQCVEIGETFTMGFVGYVDSDRLALGMAHGMSSLGSAKNVQFYDFEISLSVLGQQCNDITTRYQEQRRPLGKHATPSVQDVQIRNRAHDECIEKHLTELITCLQDNMSSTMAYAELMANMTCMLIQGSVHDRAIRRCIVSHENGRILTSLLQMRRTAVQNAKNADADPSRSLNTAYHWWLAYSNITELIGDTLGMLGNVHKSPPGEQDVEYAIQAFQDKVLPDFLKSLKQTDGVRMWFAEEQPVWHALHQTLCQLPTEVASKFVKNHWGLLEALSLRDIEDVLKFQDNIQYGDCEGITVREAHMAPKAMADLMRLISNLCGYGFDTDESFGRKVAPGPLAIRMLKKGVVPLMMKCARSDNDRMSQAAVYGLSQISRFKDCRQIMLQQPNNAGVELVQVLMTSKHVNCASSAILLVLHLGWDDEWGEPLQSIEPGIEKLCVKYASFAMTSILQRAAERKEEEKRETHMYVGKLTKQFKASSMDSLNGDDNVGLGLNDVDTRKKRSEFLTNETKSRFENRISWRQIETEDQVDIVTLTLSRSLMLLSSSLIMGNPTMTARVSKTDFLHLASACIDSPIVDACNGAFYILRNYIISKGVPSPSRFPDPEHLLDGMFYKIEECVETGKPSQYGMMLMQDFSSFYKSPEWRSIFTKMKKKDERIRWYVEKMFGRGGLYSNPAKKTARPGAKVNHQDGPMGIPQSCTSFSGNLAKCYGCGKFEGKRGQWNRCSRCEVTTYCGRKCQKQDWKKHKKHCKDLIGQNKR